MMDWRFYRTEFKLQAKLYRRDTLQNLLVKPPVLIRQYVVLCILQCRIFFFYPFQPCALLSRTTFVSHFSHLFSFGSCVITYNDTRKYAHNEQIYRNTHPQNSLYITCISSHPLISLFSHWIAFLFLFFSFCFLLCLLLHFLCALIHFY